MAQVTINCETNPIIINLLSQEVTFVDKEDKVIKTYKKADVPVSFCTIHVQHIHKHNNIPFFTEEISHVANMPDYQMGVYYIVDEKIKKFFPERPDLITLYSKANNESQNKIWARGFKLN